ncbi:MAG TPA: DUF4382 domain-containing protein [Anaeromyxobacteraceae bacterium]|jgi:hypothetical protein
MRTRNRGRLIPAAALLAAGIGCSSGTGTMSIHLVDGPGGFREVNLQVLQVDIHSDSAGWVTLGNPDAAQQPVNLLALQGGVVATLLSGVTLPAGHYSQLRLLLGAGNTVKLEDGTVHELEVPSGLQTGLKVVCNTRLPSGGATDLFIDFEAHKSVFVHLAGATGRYILRPVVRCQEGRGAGFIAGTLTAPDPGSESSGPLGGAAVTAQVLDAAGNATIVRTALSAADGTYRLDLLPLEQTYHVVAQPVVDGVVYEAKASGPLALTAALPSATWDAFFSPAAGIGGVLGTITPTATVNDADEVVARRELDAGGTPRTFIVRTAMGAVAGGVESYAMPDLEVLAGQPFTSYWLSVRRRTLAGGVETVTTGAAQPADLAGGATATVDLTVP